MSIPDNDTLSALLAKQGDPTSARSLLNLAPYLAAEVVRLRSELRTERDALDAICQHIPDEFALVPPDGGDVKTHEAVQRMAAKITRLRAERERMVEALENTIYSVEFWSEYATKTFKNADDLIFVMQFFREITATLRAALTNEEQS